MNRIPFLLLILTASAASAAEVISVDHASFAGTTDSEVLIERVVDVEPGDRLAVALINTYPSYFEYDLSGIEPPPADSMMNLADANTPRQTITVSVTHDPKFGGYIFRARAKDGNDRGRPSLPDLLIMIRVERTGWRVDFSGGFTGTSLTDPAFALRKAAPADSLPQFVREEERESDIGLGFASFVHLSHSEGVRVPLVGGRLPLGLSLGLGVDSKVENADLYAGVSVMFGNEASLTFGSVLGATTAPPAGIQIGDEVNDQNVLSNLSSRTRAGFFMGLSYRFAGGGAKGALGGQFKTSD